MRQLSIMGASPSFVIHLFQHSNNSIEQVRTNITCSPAPSPWLTVWSTLRTNSSAWGFLFFQRQLHLHQWRGGKSTLEDACAAVERLRVQGDSDGRASFGSRSSGLRRRFPWGGWYGEVLYAV